MSDARTSNAPYGVGWEFSHFLPREDRARLPVTHALCTAGATEPVVQAAAELVPPPQLRVNVFLAAVHALLLGGAEHPLAAYYPSVARRRGIPLHPADPIAIAAELVDFTQNFHDELAATCRTGLTQTNEVGRLAVLRPALAEVARRGWTRVGLLDAGCSAGANLLLDHYRLQLGETSVGPTDAPVVVIAACRGGEPPLALPEFAQRVGLDQHLVDPNDAAACTWLLACVWPDDLERFTRLEAALAALRHYRGDLDLLQGDLVDDLERAAELVPDDQHLVVLHSWALAYLPPPRRAELVGLLTELSHHRALSWICFERPEVLADFGIADPRPPGTEAQASLLALSELCGGVRHSTVLAAAHPHGAWVRWLS